MFCLFYFLFLPCIRYKTSKHKIKRNRNMWEFESAVVGKTKRTEEVVVCILRGRRENEHLVPPRRWSALDDLTKRLERS